MDRTCTFVRQSPWSAFDPWGLKILPMNPATQAIFDDVKDADPALARLVKELEASPYVFEFKADRSKEDKRRRSANASAM